MTTGRVRILFWTMFGLGLLARVVAGNFSLGFVHPDEHQQSLEVAQGIVYGPHVTFWEYERGMRHYLYPGLLSAVLFLLERAGIHDPIVQVVIIKTALSFLVLGVMTVFARTLIEDGRVGCGLVFMGLASLNPDFISMSVRTLSETAMLVPFVLALAWLRKWPAVAGLLLALTFAFRFQSAFFIAPICAIAVFDDWRRRPEGGWRSWPSLRLLLGLGVGLLADGGIDRWTWGSWFQSPIEYFRANILEHKAAEFGVEPPTFYLRGNFWLMLATSPLIPLLLPVGMLRDLRSSIIILTFILVHTAIGHKEYRFLWPSIPLVFLLISEGFEGVTARLTGSWRRWFVVAVVGSLLAGAVYRTGRVDWNQEPSRSCSIALVKIGRYPDLHGLAIYGIKHVFTGNYFYLRNDVPLVLQKDYGLETAQGLKNFKADPAWSTGKINYLMIYKNHRADFPNLKLEAVDAVGEFRIYRIGE